LHFGKKFVWSACIIDLCGNLLEEILQPSGLTSRRIFFNEINAFFLWLISRDAFQGVFNPHGGSKLF